MADFGVIIGCCFQDMFLARGCCASVRHFLGDVPICLIVDGTFPVDSLEKTYHVQVINQNTIKNSMLRDRSFGWGKNKMISFWESPWQHFLYLDADTNVWGNVLQYVNFEDYDLIIDIPAYKYTDADITEYFFDIPSVEKYFPDFDWQKHRDEYVCPGVVFGTRGVYSLEEYEEILDFTDRHPRVFKYGDMGFFNFMLFRAVDAGRLRVGKADFQIIAPDFDQQDLKRRFPVSSEGPVIQNNEASVIHWCGPKPITHFSKAYAEPMNFSRRLCLEQERGYKGWLADLWLQWEDTYSTALKYKNKAKQKLKKRLSLGV